MTMKNTNPTETKSWKQLTTHYNEVKNTHIKSLFLNDSKRKNKFTINFNDFEFDYSKNRITEETIKYLLELAQEVDLKSAIEAQFSGEIINQTEKRAVLHTALRNQTNHEVLVDGQNIVPEIKEALLKIEGFTNKVVSGDWKGYTGKSITDVVNIGIGGSDLGPDMVVESLKYYKNRLNVHFVSNIDGDHVQEVIKNLNPETTLFVIVSKTFTTQETLTNATTIKKWFLQTASNNDVAKHFVAVSTNLETVKNFGIASENIFPMWDWVGGRFSLWSAVGLSISLAVGFTNFKDLLIGAFEMDEHFKNTPFEKNAPVILSLIGIWYTNFFNAETEAILPYTQYLNKLPSYLQQAIMESNGKSVDRNGEPVNYQTGNVIWGSPGTNSQHAFMQLLHQGTKLIPADFIGYKESLYGNKEHHDKLMANFFAQTQALAEGKTKEEVHLDLKTQGKISEIATLLPYKIFEGNKPSTSILIKKLTPKTLGSLISFYEHKIFVQGIIWNIYSYDQFGVELGKELAQKLYKKS
ncbi:MAG: glucose-6-phosphate isomerase [Lutibacter sp.]|uniref:glucose-6-phosphate isomerase n=1 Tax=Lutibacter sp. TaxID=1925666 RepID=UPI001796D0D9|nr:glucose-6-phosphate isomerase [Lutibacter sp.]MBT8318383.1 glucose-6-phosphate isomerase [Lutibacter sp.]NNJ59241.1 glucose-6-phosphate isomerase [Lutibacter sp.]